MSLLSHALQLQKESAVGMLEYAHAMLMFDGEKMINEANQLYQLAARATPIDAMERLDLELARTELAY